MRPTVRLALAALRKTRAQMLALTGLVALAAMMVDVGLVLLTGYPGSFDEQARAVALPQIMILEKDRVYSDAQIARLASRPGTVAVEHEPVQLFSNVAFVLRGGDARNMDTAFFSDYGADRDLDIPRLRPGARPLDDDGIYLPSYFQVTAGYAIGDTFTATLDGVPLDFTVRGFTDDIAFSFMTAITRIYVGPATLAELADQFPASSGRYVKIQTDEPAQARTLAGLEDQDYLTGLRVNDPADTVVNNPNDGIVEVGAWTYSDIRFRSLFMGEVLAACLLLFAVLVGTVSLVVVRFRVVASIEESMANIGVLKAVGYTSGQVAGSLLWQFGAVVAAGALIGAGAGQALLPLVAGMLERQSARGWSPGVAVLPAAGAFVAVTATVLVVTGLVALRIRRLSPLTALRAGLAVHSFRRNHLPLAVTRGPLTWLLAFKAAFQAKGQMVTVGVVAAAVAFMGVTIATTYQNIGVRSGTLPASVMGETPDVIVVATGTSWTTAAQIRTELADRDGVRSSVLYSSWLPMRVDGNSTVAIATDDFGQTDGASLYRGRWPAHANEVAISWREQTRSGKGIGDTVRVAAGGSQADYLVTGLIQPLFNGGRMIALTTDGVHALLPQFAHTAVYVYLDDPGQADSVATAVGHRWPGTQVVTYKQARSAVISTYGDVLFVVLPVLMDVAFAVITLVVFLVLSMTIQRGRRGFGIQKAVGFTSGQLVRQTVTTYLPVLVVASTVGAVAGHLGFPLVIDTFFHLMGNVYTAQASASVPTTALVTVGIILVSFLVSTAVASRVRRVAPYVLVAE